MLMLAVGGALGYFGANFFLRDSGPSDYPKYYGLFILLLTPVIWLFTVGWHELGHVVVGKTQEFTFYGFTVGPFAWKPGDNGRVKFQWNKNLNVAGGVAVMLPKGEERMSQRFIWFAAGGPLASLVLAGLMYAFYLLLPTGNFLRLLSLATGGMSLLIFVATILPFRSGGFASDGLRILTFLRGGATAEADLTGLRAIAHLRAGRPHAELPIEDLRRVSENESVPGQQRLTSDYYQYYYLLAAGKIDEAGLLYASIMERIDLYPAGTQGGFHLEQALFEAVYRRDADAAAKALDKVDDGPMIEAAYPPLVRAAIAGLSGNEAAVRAELPAVERGLSRLMDQSRVPVIREWIAAWRKGETPAV